MSAILVRVTNVGGAYMAVAGSPILGRASCTSSEYVAAARAAGKALRVVEAHVLLKPTNPERPVCFWALPHTAPAADLVGYKTAHQLATEAAEEYERRWQQRASTGPGSYGERLD